VAVMGGRHGAPARICAGKIDKDNKTECHRYNTIKHLTDKVNQKNAQQ
jgi:hypothetical protein